MRVSQLAVPQAPCTVTVCVICFAVSTKLLPSVCLHFAGSGQTRALPAPGPNAFFAPQLAMRRHWISKQQLVAGKLCSCPCRRQWAGDCCDSHRAHLVLRSSGLVHLYARHLIGERRMFARQSPCSSGPGARSSGVFGFGPWLLFSYGNELLTLHSLQLTCAAVALLAVARHSFCAVQFLSD
jgi:hypothetical protein